MNLNPNLHPNLNPNLHKSLSSVRDLLLRPTAENLERAIPYLESAVGSLRNPGAWSPTPELALLIRQVRMLHERAGRIRLGAARLGVAESSGYTHGGRPGAPVHRPHLAVTG